MGERAVMGRPVAIASAFETSLCSETPGASLEEMIFDAATQTLASAGITRETIDQVVTGSSDQVDGRAISVMLTGGPAGGYMKDILNVSSTGEHAFVAAWMRIASGMVDSALVLSWSKCSEAPMGSIDRLGMEPFFLRPLAAQRAVMGGLHVSRVLRERGAPEDEIADVVVTARARAARNPRAHLRLPVTHAEVRASPVVAWPLRALHFPPFSDGAVGLVLMSGERARTLGRPVAWVRGLGWAWDGYDIASRRPGGASALTAAVAQASRMAGIPPNRVNVAEIHGVTAFHERWLLEDLGFTGGGSPVVNPSGGALGANPDFATGLVRVAEAALQVLGQAGPHQVPEARLGLAHAAGGLLAQSHTVIILGGDPPRGGLA